VNHGRNRSRSPLRGSVTHHWSHRPQSPLSPNHYFRHLVARPVASATAPPSLNSPRTTTHALASLLPTVPRFSTQLTTGRLVAGSLPRRRESNNGPAGLPFSPPVRPHDRWSCTPQHPTLVSPQRQLDDSIRVPFPPRIFLGTASG